MSFEAFRPELAHLGENMLDIFENKFFALAATYVERHKNEPNPYSKAIKEFVDDYFEALNIHPKFIAESRPDFKEMREHLHKDAGIVLSNHPDEYLDIPTIATALATRDDVKIMVNQELVDRLTSSFGRQFIVPSFKRGRELAQARDEVVGHIQKGGVFLIFPSGRVTSTIKFEGFVKQLLKSGGVKDDDMIYSFYINQEDVRACSTELVKRLLAITPGMLAQKVQNPREENPLIIRVDERYSRVEEYRAIVEGLKGDQASLALVNHYLTQFGVSPTD